MRHYDFSPLFRATIGYDRIADMMDNMTRANDAQTHYPPYNITKKDLDSYRISLALAGFSTADLNIEQHENALVIEGKKSAQETPTGYLHQGISQRSFSRRFHLADHIKVVSAQMSNGLLHIDLVREIPQALQPRRIEIAPQTQADAKPIKAVKPASKKAA